jgi:ATP-binding cassette, subfamily F, member 3
MISVENVCKSYGGRDLFYDASFQISQRERVGMVGRNGHGKTTLFRLIIGEESTDSGSVNIPKNYRIGYVRQKIEFTEETILSEGMRGLPASDLGQSWKVEKVLMGLGFLPQDMQRHPKEFSGGFQVRLNLAKILVGDPDLLLLDEPTNYLDITSIRWLERYLKKWPRELLLITHDRMFMDSVVTHTIGIHRRKVRKIKGDTTKYYDQLAQDEEVFEKTRLNDEKRRKEVQLFITRFRAKARLANMVQSRVKTLAKMEKRNKLEELASLDFSFQSQPFPAKYLLSADNISFAYQPSKPLIQNLNTTVTAGDRICIVGPNGKGKTTLLKLLAGELAPHTGKLTFHPAVTQGYFEQTHVKSLVDSRTVLEEIIFSHPAVDQQLARNICGAMMFSGDDALKKIGVLSGGEKSRVLLGKILVSSMNLLLLDEPTNHLDMDACDALLAAIDHFEGTVVMVTHNEMFLHALAQRLIVFREDGVQVFEGGYQRFLESGGWGDEKTITATADTPSNSDPNQPKLSKKELRRLRSEIISARSKALNPMERRITQLEQQIETREKEISELNTALIDASQEQNASEITRLSQSLHQKQQETEKRYTELDLLTTKMDRKAARFEAELAKIEAE